MLALAWSPPLRSAAILLLAGSLMPSWLEAQGWIQPDRPGPGFQVERLRTHVQVRIVDRVAHVEVEEWFRNPGRVQTEGIYLYPLPGETVFQSYSLFQGDLELTGETMDAAEARAIYEEIVRRRKDPALIELVGHGLVRARVFPIDPGETRRITLRYTQLLDRAGDALQLRYAAGRAAHGGTWLWPADGHAEHPQLRTGPGTGTVSTPLTFSVTVEEEDRFLDPFSPTHHLQVTREAGELRIRPAAELTGSFLLLLPLAGSPVRLTLATHRPSSEDGYFMLSLSPGEVAASAMPRDLTAVVDVSGSMSGEKMEQTRRALLQLLGSLGPEDRFRLIRFSSGVEAYRLGWTAAVEEELREAGSWVASLRARGGTNIAGALEEAFREETPDGRLPVVVFLTDGLPTVGERSPEAIADRADQIRGRARVFAFGVGYDVDTYLLDRLTVAGRGSVQYVGPGEDVEHALGLLAMKIQHPVLADLELEELPVRIRDLYPTLLPDLFVGEELTLFGRYSGPGQGRITVRGNREGRPARFSVGGAFPEHALGNDFLPRLWAARKIGELTREVRLRGADPELVAEIRETALRYGILTEFTSYLVLEPERVAGGPILPPAFRDEVPRAGRRAVLGATASGMARDARTPADVVAMEAMAVDAAGIPGVGERGANPELRLVAGRAFILRDGVWVDRLHDGDAATVQVAAFSAAYFDLLQALPELREWWGTLHTVTVAGRGVSLQVGEEGVTSLPAAEIRRLVREFRADSSRRRH
jgi:Ca-activated chloride channel homolog